LSTELELRRILNSLETNLTPSRVDEAANTLSKLRAKHRDVGKRKKEQRKRNRKINRNKETEIKT